MSGRHRGAGYFTTRTRAVVVVVALVAGIGALIIWQSSGSSACGSPVRLTVGASPELAPVVQETATAWAAGAQASGNRCVQVEVKAIGSADVAASVAAAGGVSLMGLTTATTNSNANPTASPAAANVPSAPVPDVWIPDSTSWLVRIRAAGPNLVPTQAPSVARSPVVLAMPEPIAASLGWPRTAITWTALLQRITTGPALKLGIVEPNRDAVGLAGLVALGNAAAAAGASAEQATIAAMRALVTGRSSASSDLLSHFPKAGDPATIAAGLGAAPISEQAMIAYNRGEPIVKLAGFYVEPAPVALDYPYAVMPNLPTEKAAVADQLLAALSGTAYQDRLAAVGLRDQDGVPSGQGFPTLPGAPSTVTGGALDGATVGKALTTWISVTRPARMLAVIDVSGSMALPVPSAGGASRGQVSVAAAQQGMALFDDSWAVGLWTFSTNLDGAKDYKELLPIRLMSEQRPNLAAALATVAPIPNGQTGLYDTVLAAYKTVQVGWDPNSVNSVVLLTDGQNQDTNGLTLDQLTDQLKSILDPRRPIQVIAIGVGDDVSQAELERITGTTGGGTFIARDPSAIGPIFLKALALRPPLPTT